MKVIEDILGKGSLNQSVNDKAVCRTAPAKPGLSKIYIPSTVIKIGLLVYTKFAERDTFSVQEL